MNLNKSTKIWLNSLIGIVISTVLLYSLWLQIQAQLSKLDGADWWQGDTNYLIVGLLLMPLNLSVEVFKWKLLAGATQPISTLQAWKSYFAGIALSFLTPNRVGEYPGRILYLKRKNTIRLISVSILGAFAQFISLFLYGIAGLVYYNMAFPGYWQKIVLMVCCMAIILLVLVFFQFEKWVAGIENMKWLRRFQTYSMLIQRFTLSEQFVVLGLSMLRFTIFTIQYLMLLKWMGISLISTEGFLTATLYFWSIAVIPSVAFSELGVRGQVSLFLFHPYTQNTIGILTATVSLWCINLILPAIVGSILLLRVRLLK